MRRAVVGAIFLLVAAATARAFIPPPRERPPTLEEAANELAVYRAAWPGPTIALGWEVIFEGRIADYEPTSLPTPSGGRMSCTRITFAVERSLAGDPDSIIQALTTVFPPGTVPGPNESWWPPNTAQVQLPIVGSQGLFFLRRADSTESWACNPARLLYSSSRGSWIENARGVAVFNVTEPAETFDYDQFVAALEAAIHVRTLSQLTAQASLIARVAVGRRVDMAVTDRDGARTVRYPITVAECYRGGLAPGPCAIAFENRTLTDTEQERYLVDKLQIHEGGEALVFGALRDSTSLNILPGGVLTIDRQGMVDLGLNAAGDTASVILKPLASIEQQLK